MELSSQEPSWGQIALPRWGGGEWSWSRRQAQDHVLAFFFKTECPTCQLTAPYIERLHQALGDGALQVIGIAQNVAEEVQPWIERYHLTFPLLLEAPPYPLSRAFNLQSVPTLLWLTPQGAVRERVEGFSRQALQQLAEQLAQTVGREVPVLFPEGDPAPAWQPG